MSDSLTERPLVNLRVVKYHFVAGMVFFTLALIYGLLYATVFHRIYPFPGIEQFSPGRVRMLHTNLIAFGFIFNSFLGALYWAVPRLTGVSVFSDKLAWLIFGVWQLICLGILLGISHGHAQAIEWGETPMFVDHFIVLGALLLWLQFYTTIVKTKERALYVSLWYITAGLVWTGLTYIMGNYLPQHFIPGTAGAAITGLYIHDLVGLFITPMGWGLMYFFVPIILKKPIYSHALSLVGFWGLAFFYPLNGVHHFLWSPIPMFAQYGAVVSTIGVEIVVTTVIVNFFCTLYGKSEMVRTNLSIRWFYIGMIFYFTTCLQCAFQTTLTFQKIIHFTDWVVGHAHLVMFGVFGFWLIGMLNHLWPRLTGNEWWSHRLNVWHFWLTGLGMFVMFLTLTMGGLVQGFLWKALSPWEDSLIYSQPFWYVRLFAGVLIFAGHVLFLWNLYRTALNVNQPHLETEYNLNEAEAAA